MNKTLQAALTAVLVVGSASMAHADLSEDGATGLILNPTAEKPGAGQVRVQGEYARYKEGDEHSNFFALRGAGGLDKNFELSGGLQRVTDGEHQSGISLGAKYVFMPRLAKVAARRINVAAG